MAVSIWFGCQTWVIHGTMSTFWSAAIAASASRRCTVIDLVGRCRGLRRPGPDVVPTLYICLVSTADICPVSAAESVLSQQQTSILSQQKTSVLSQQHILCVSETCSGPDTSKSPHLDNRKVTFQTDGTPKSRIAVRFQWAQSRGELLKN